MDRNCFMNAIVLITLFDHDGIIIKVQIKKKIATPHFSHFYLEVSRFEFGSIFIKVELNSKYKGRKTKSK